MLTSTKMSHRSIYTLDSPSTRHMQYLKDSAIVALKQFCKEARDPKLTGPILSEDDVTDIQDLGEQIITEQDPLVLIDIIRGTACRCELYVDPDGGERTRHLLGNIATIYYVFALGFVDLCCTMNRGPSIINDTTTAAPQVLCTNKDVSIYPRLVVWMKKNGGDWMDALEDFSGIYAENDYNMKETILFMTEP
jgi:hypothetical protein